MNIDTTPALLVMDVQCNIVSMVAAEETPLLDRLGIAIAAARAAGIPIFYVTVGFREGYPEVHPRNKAFGALLQNGGFLRGEQSEVHPAIAPEPHDVLISKLRVSAFAGSELAVLLRAGGIDALVLAGIATSGVVLSTVREAADRDLRLTVLSDGCMDRDDEVHRVLMDKVFPHQASVTPVEGWVASLTI